MRCVIRVVITLALALASNAALAGPAMDSGALDATFGSSGKVILGSATGYTSPVANDVAIQADGKVIVAGYQVNSSDSSAENWRVLRLNANGTLDTSFNGSGEIGPHSGASPTRAQAVAVRPDGRIVVAGPAGTSVYVDQFLANGSPDPSFHEAAPPIASGDSATITRLLIEANGSIDVAGTYYANHSGFNSNEFYFARIGADGSTVEPFQYLFGSGPNADDHALDLAIDNQGRYVVVGYHRGANGNYDFAAIRIRSDLYDVDNTFGSGGQTTLDFGDNGDYANAVALTATGYIALGGQANGQAALALLDPTGIQANQFTFVFGIGGGLDTISKLILDNYDTEYPQLLAIGSGNQSYASGPGGAAGLMFGVARLNFPGPDFSLDTGYSGDGTEGVYFNIRPNGIGSFVTTNNGRSASFDKGKLVVVGDTLGTDMAIARLATFDGVFKNGFDAPSL